MKKCIVLLVLFFSMSMLSGEDYIKLLTPGSGWNSSRKVTISGETNLKVNFVQVIYNSIPLRLPVHGGRFSREFVAGPGLNTIYAEAAIPDNIVADTVSFYSKAPAKAMKIVLMWDTDGTDVDLHVIEPTGEECYYGNNSTKIGGSLDVDVTQGYGPEVYTLAAPTKGTYEIKVKYYSDNGYPQTKVTVFVVTYEGTPDEKIRKFETMLTKTGATVKVDVVSLE